MVPTLRLVDKRFNLATKQFRDCDRMFSFLALANEQNADDLGLCEELNATKNDIAELLNNPEKASKVRFVTVNFLHVVYKERLDEYDPDEEEEKDFESPWAELCELVKQLPRLKSLIYQGRLEFDKVLTRSIEANPYSRRDLWEHLRRQSMPSNLIRTLQDYQPNCELHVKGWIRSWEQGPEDDETELALQASPNLRSLELLVTDVHHYSGIDDFIEVLKRIITSAPNLEHVRFGLADVCYPDSLPGDEWDAVALDGFPYGYLHREKYASTIIPSLASDHRHLDSLIPVIRESTLEYLDIGRVLWHNFFTSEGEPNARFPSLLHLYVGVDDEYHGLLDDPFGVYGDLEPDEIVTVKDRESRPILTEEIISYLKVCNHLETLYLQFWNVCTITDKKAIFSRHGPTLKKFHIMDGFNPCDWTGRRKNPISIEQLQEINALCPLLEDLGIVVLHSEDGNAEREIFNEIAKFQNLRAVTLIMDLHLVKRKREILPNNPLCLDYEGSDQKIWALLRSGDEKKSKIKELKIVVGEWTYRPDNYKLQCGRLEWENPTDNHLIIIKENLTILTDDKTVFIKEGTECSSKPMVTPFPEN